MENKSKTNQIKTWVKDNKGKIILGLGALATAVITTAIVSKSKTTIKSTENFIEDKNDEGKDLEMHFIDPENREILWKDLCTESYMEACKESGSNYESIRKLNDLDEA